MPGIPVPDLVYKYEVYQGYTLKKIDTPLFWGVPDRGVY